MNASLFNWIRVILFNTRSFANHLRVWAHRKRPGRPFSVSGFQNSCTVCSLFAESIEDRSSVKSFDVGFELSLICEILLSCKRQQLLLDATLTACVSAPLLRLSLVCCVVIVSLTFWDRRGKDAVPESSAMCVGCAASSANTSKQRRGG